MAQRSANEKKKERKRKDELARASREGAEEGRSSAPSRLPARGGSMYLLREEKRNGQQ